MILIFFSFLILLNIFFKNKILSKMIKFQFNINFIFSEELFINYNKKSIIYVNKIVGSKLNSNIKITVE